MDISNFEMVTFEKKDKVAIIRLDRHEALNALCEQLMTELGQIVHYLDSDDETHVMVLTGFEKAFAAGADIKEMADKSFAGVYGEDFITAKWEEVSKCRKPIIAAVSGYALGGGCELAMMCDILIAAENTKFAQPEITIGTLPGAGGTQRLTRAVGKSNAMELCLTGRMIEAKEALYMGLISKIVPTDKIVDEAVEMASTIAKHSLPVAMMVKEAINQSYETSLKEGLHFERRLFHSSFALEDRAEGMMAFKEKRKPEFKNK